MGSTMITGLSRTEQSQFDSALAPFKYEVKGSTSKTTTVIIRTADEDRAKTKTKIEKQLGAAKILYTSSRSGGSIGRTEVNFSKHNVNITYKVESGGMAETTLNATITELFPALAFMAGKNYKTARDIKAFYEFVSNAEANGVFVNDKDKEAGKAFILAAPSSSKYEEKMKNAIAILKYLYKEDSQSPIEQVYWGYRAKPENVAASHKGDIFIKFKSGGMKGVSLKAGGEKTAEPLLNTYVNKLFDDYGDTTTKDTLIKNVYTKIHKKLGLSEDWLSTGKKDASIDVIEKFRLKEPEKYETMYDEMLELCRTAIVERVGKDMKKTKEYILKQVLNKDENVPLEVVKAVQMNYQFVTDDNALEIFLPEATSITTEKSASSKQNWHIHLKNDKKTVTMNMSIRSNKSKPENKIAQGFNLAVKFNGLEK